MLKYYFDEYLSFKIHYRIIKLWKLLEKFGAMPHLLKMSLDVYSYSYAEEVCLFVFFSRSYGLIEVWSCNVVLPKRMIKPSSEQAFYKKGRSICLLRQATDWVECEIESPVYRTIIWFFYKMVNFHGALPLNSNLFFLLTCWR